MFACNTLHTENNLFLAEGLILEIGNIAKPESYYLLNIYIHIDVCVMTQRQRWPA